MSGFLTCFSYLMFIGLLSFFVGRILPKQWFSYERFPFRIFPFELDGKFYDVFGIRRWKGFVPDMSRVFPSLIPSKKLSGLPDSKEIELMLLETCIAEYVHALLGIVGFYCVHLWEGTGGWVLAFLFLLGNVPFWMIQRYNRPKLIRLLNKLQEREVLTSEIRQTMIHEECFDFKM